MVYIILYLFAFFFLWVLLFYRTYLLEKIKSVSKPYFLEIEKKNPVLKERLRNIDFDYYSSLRRIKIKNILEDSNDTFLIVKFIHRFNKITILISVFPFIVILITILIMFIA